MKGARRSERLKPLSGLRNKRQGHGQRQGRLAKLHLGKHAEKCIIGFCFAEPAVSKSAPWLRSPPAPLAVSPGAPASSSGLRSNGIDADHQACDLLLDTHPRADIDSKVRYVGQEGRSAPQYRACNRNGPRMLVLRPLQRSPGKPASRRAYMLGSNAATGLCFQKRSRQSREEKPGFRVFGGAGALVPIPLKAAISSSGS